MCTYEYYTFIRWFRFDSRMACARRKKEIRDTRKGEGREKIVHSPFDLRSKKEAATCKNQRTDRMAASPMGRLTEEQRKAVVDSWALVEPDATEHGLKFFQQ